MDKLQAIAEVDFMYWWLEKTLETINQRTPLDQIIDTATGYDKDIEKEARYYVRRIKFLRRKYDF